MTPFVQLQDTFSFFLFFLLRPLTNLVTFLVWIKPLYVWNLYISLIENDNKCSTNKKHTRQTSKMPNWKTTISGRGKKKEENVTLRLATKFRPPNTIRTNKVLKIQQRNDFRDILYVMTGEINLNLSNLYINAPHSCTSHTLISEMSHLLINVPQL